MVVARLSLAGAREGHVDWVAAAVAGFAAGAALMVLQLLWAATGVGEGPWRVTQHIAALVLGPQVMQVATDSFDAVVTGIALLTHYVLGIGFGLALAAAMTALRSVVLAERALTVGAIGGMLLYGLNFHLLTVLFPWMAGLRSGEALFAHLLFGVAAAMLYRRLARTIDPR